MRNVWLSPSASDVDRARKSTLTTALLKPVILAIGHLIEATQASEWTQAIDAGRCPHRSA
jgi:hypothetical protein